MCYMWDGYMRESKEKRNVGRKGERKMTVRKMKKLKRCVAGVFAAGMVMCTVASTSNAALHATAISKDVKSDGHYAYLAQVWAKNTAYNTSYRKEAYFSAQLRRVQNGRIINKQTSSRKFFNNLQKTYANSPTAVWPQQECRASME